MLDGANLTDEGSTFSYNGAGNGSIAYCKNCTMTFKKSVFIGNYANQGGLFYIKDNGTLVMEDV